MALPFSSDAPDFFNDPLPHEAQDFLKYPLLEQAALDVNPSPCQPPLPPGESLRPTFHFWALANVTRVPGRPLGDFDAAAFRRRLAAEWSVQPEQLRLSVALASASDTFDEIYFEFCLCELSKILNWTISGGTRCPRKNKQTAEDPYEVTDNL